MKNKKPTFNSILKQTEEAHSEILMGKARRANRIAKSLYGYKKQLAYAVKHRAISGMLKNTPDKIFIQRDLVLTDFVLVKLKRSKSGLHFPVEELALHI